MEAGSWEHQRVVEGTLADIAERAAKAEIGSPAILLVGEVASLRATLQSQLELPQPARRAAFRHRLLLR